jgi:hypothetical protein
MNTGIYFYATAGFFSMFLTLWGMIHRSNIKLTGRVFLFFVVANGLGWPLMWTGIYWTWRNADFKRTWGTPEKLLAAHEANDPTIRPWLLHLFVGRFVVRPWLAVFAWLGTLIAGKPETTDGSDVIFVGEEPFE